jgi:hypothetical protein
MESIELVDVKDRWRRGRMVLPFGESGGVERRTERAPRSRAPEATSQRKTRRFGRLKESILSKVGCQIAGHATAVRTGYLLEPDMG